MTLKTAPVIALLLLGSLAWSDQPQPVRKALELAAQSLQVAPEQVTIVSAEAVKWPDSSLGVRRLGQMYMQVITPGYKVILRSGDRRLEYHTNMGDQAVLAADTAAGDAGTEAAVPAVAGDCRADLARRLRAPADQIQLASVTPQLFPDASLGLAQPNEAAAQAQTPGYLIVLTTGKTRYLYTASETAFRYGGPLDSWRFSALYLVPAPDEPNLNGSLLQVSLAGTNPVVMLEGVSSYYAQPNGSVLATRRTSRSSFDLLYLAPGAPGADVTRLASVFDCGPATTNLDGTRWAAVTRAGAGGPWQLALGTLGAEGVETLPLPVSARPDGLWWTPDNPVLRITQDERASYYELKLDDPARPWQQAAGFVPPERDQYHLNKSETLVVKTDVVDGKPVTCVSKEWFTGDDNPVATIEGFSPTSHQVSRPRRFLLLSGQRNNAKVALTVDLATGEVLETIPQPSGPAQLLTAPPQSWLVTNALGKLLSEQ